MADTKISAMPPATTLTGSEIGPLVQGGTNVQTTVTDLVSQTIQTAPGDFRTDLGLGTMAVQDADDVNITEGTIGVSHLQTLGLTGYLYGNNTSDVTASTTIPLSDIGTYYGAFHYDTYTQLNGGINSNSTDPIVVDSTTGFSNSGYLLIDNEIIQYTGVTATSFTGITRGVAGSQNATHADNSYVTSAQADGANTANVVQLNSTDLSNGVTLVDNSKITFANAGTYNVQFSAQLSNASNTIDNLVIWYRLNGTNIDSSASLGTVPAKHAGGVGASIMTVNLFITVTAGQYVELMWSSLTGNGVIVSYPPSPSSPLRPGSPAVILTANQIA